MVKGQGVSMYTQIAEEIQKDLLNLRYGEKIQTEDELMKQYHVSRGTIRQAIELLVSKGLVYKVHGKGTYRGSDYTVATSHNKLLSFTTTAMQNGGIPTIADVKLSTVPADANVAEKLILPIGEKVYKLSRYRGEEKKGITCYAEAYIVKKVLPKLKKEDLEQSIIQMVTEKFHIKIAKAMNTLKALLPEEVPNIDVPKDRAVLKNEFVAYGEDGKPFLYNISYNWDKEQGHQIESTIE